MSDALAKIALKYLVSDQDRHGNERFYVRVPGRPKVRIKEEPGSKAFLLAYKEALRPPPEPEPLDPAEFDFMKVKYRRGTIGKLIQEYHTSSDFCDLAGSTRAVRYRLLARLAAKVGKSRARDLKAKKVRQWRDAPKGPEAGNAVVKTLRQVLALAVSNEELPSNVAALVTYRKPPRPDGHEPWDIEDVRAFVRTHPRGTVAYLALCLYLFTAQRRSDVHLFGRQHERDNGQSLRFTQVKNSTRRPVHMDIPIIAPLRDAIDACDQVGQLAYIVSEHTGRPYSSAQSFGNRMSKWCREAGIKRGKGGHGIRKAQGDLLAELGATAHEIMSVMGHTTLKQAEVYTRKADRRRMAHSGLRRLEDALNQEQIVPLSQPVKKVGQKRRPSD